ncbi:MAG TPA: hypothetical protein VFE79_23685 [Paraburkholderia sp.]|jgi:hypothetical protein|nr:hypothetical protein [Paraburkholderia sp.]
MDDDQVNLDEIADNKRRREAARVAALAQRPDALADEPTDEPTPKQWARHAAKWLGARTSLMQTRRTLTLKKKTAVL